MKQIPILFSTEMVPPIQKDIKLMTRRTNGLDKINEHPITYVFLGMETFSRQNFYCAKFKDTYDNKIIHIKCPYGKPGDVLWVREKFAYRDCDTSCHKVRIEYAASEGEKYYIFPKNSMRILSVPLGSEKKWMPNIHMPKDACRIFLEITSIRVERLQDISEEDAISEGVDQVDYVNVPKDGIKYNTPTYRQAFRTLWMKINGPESWNSNPWVWIVSFKSIEKP